MLRIHDDTVFPVYHLCTRIIPGEESDKLDKLGHKIASFGNLIKFRKGKVKFVFPDEYQGKTIVPGASSATSTFFCRLFGRGAQ